MHKFNFKQKKQNCTQSTFFIQRFVDEFYHHLASIKVIWMHLKALLQLSSSYIWIFQEDLNVPIVVYYTLLPLVWTQKCWKAQAVRQCSVTLAALIQTEGLPEVMTVKRSVTWSYFTPLNNDKAKRDIYQRLIGVCAVWPFVEMQLLLTDYVLIIINKCNPLC